MEEAGTESKTNDLCFGLNNLGFSFIEKKNEETHYNKGVCKLNIDKVIENSEKDLAEYPNDCFQQNQLALLYKEVGKFNESAQIIDKLVALEPNNEDYQNNRQLIHRLQNEKNNLQVKSKDKNYSETEKISKKLLEEAPNAYDIQKEYILSLINNDKFHELLLFLLNDVSEEHKHVYKDLNYYLALSLYHVCKFEEAKELIYQLKKEEIEDDLKNQCDQLLKKIEINESVINEGEKLIEKKEFDKAIILYDSELGKKENFKAFNSFLLSKRAFCHYKKEEYDKALEDSDKSIIINQNNSYSYVIRGMIKTQMKSEDAKQDFEKAKKIDPAFSNLTTEIKKVKNKIIDPDTNKFNEITPKGTKKNKLDRIIKNIPFVLRASDNDIDRNNNCLNKIPKNKLKIYEENITSFKEMENKSNNVIINDNEISLGLKVFKEGCDIKFGQDKEKKFEQEKSEIVVKRILYSISINEEKDITFKSEFIKMIEELANLECSDKEKAEKLEKLLQNTGVYIPLKMYIGGLYIFTTEKINKEVKKEILREISGEANLEELLEMKGSFKYKKSQEDKNYIGIKSIYRIGGETNEDCNEWLKTVKTKNSNFIEYSEFREIFKFFNINLQNKLSIPINIIKKKYKRKINYMKIIENLKHNKNKPFYFKEEEDLPEIYCDKISFKKEFQYFKKHEVEINKSYPDIIIGMKIHSLKSMNGTPVFENPILKNKIYIKFQPTPFCSMDYKIEVILMKYPK